MRRARLRPNEPACAAILLALLLNAMFFPYIWGDLNLMSGAHDDPSITSVGGPNGDPNLTIDQSHWKWLDANGSALLDEPTFPLVHHELFVDHTVPLWNPDAAFGTPLAAAMQQEPFYPLTAIVMLHPSPATFTAYILLRLFVAGLMTYFFLRFFVGFIPALGGGIAFMLNGYFFKYETMPHLSVETLTGALFLGVELVLRRRRPWLAVPFLAFAVWFDFLGGMPESSFIGIVFASAYAAFRILTVPAYRAAWVTRTREICLALGCGFACASFLIFPFLELMLNSFNVHEPAKNGGTLPGLVADASPITSLASYAMPMLFGPPWEANGLPFNDGHFGVVIIFCALAAVVYAILKPRSGLAVPIAFFASAVAFLVAKRYGVPAVNWVGALPVVRLVLLMKYQEADTAFAMAVLVGFGLHALFFNPDRRRAIALTAFFASLGLLQLAYNTSVYLTNVQQPRAAFYFYVYLLGGLAALVTIAAIAVAGAMRSDRSSLRLNAGLAVLAIATEMSLNYFVPMYYFVDPGPSKLQDPYLGAPYIDYLHRNAGKGDRIYAEATSYLEPDWAQAFDLKDIRDIDAIYDERYLPYVRAFIPKDDKADLVEDFTGTSSYTLGTPVGRKFLALASVRYIVTGDIGDPTSLGARIGRSLAARTGARGAPVPGTFELANQWCDGFAQARDSQDLDYRFDLAPDATRLSLASGLDDTFWTLNGGVAALSLTLVDARGTARTLLQRRFDSRRERRGWQRAELDVRRFAGTSVLLTFSLRTNRAAAQTHGYWGALREERVPGEPDPFVLAQHYRDINVFAFAQPIPHGALYENITLSPDDRTTLDLLSGPRFDVYKSAVVAQDSIPAELAGAVRNLAGQTPARVRGATLDAYSPTRIAYHTNEVKPALLFLSDTFYPGWKAFVDSHETPILRTDYLFRGIVLGPGKHLVEFRYEPLTFRAGLALCAGGLLALAGFAFRTKRAAAGNLTRAVVAA